MKTYIRKSVVSAAMLGATFALTSPCAGEDQTTGAKPARENTAAPKSGFVPIPALYYTPETELAAGGLFIYYFRNPDDPPDAKPSQIKPLVITTEKKQLITSFLVSRRWNQGRDHVSLFARYRRYPDKLWQPGSDSPASSEEDYSTNLASIETLWERNIGQGWNAGPVAVFSGYDITHREDDGMIASGELTGSDRSRIGGAGVQFSRDTRDNLFSAESGQYDSLRALRYSSFHEVQADSRRYFSLPARHLVATRAFAHVQNGKIPFRELASLGGPDRMRGFYEGRFRDRMAAAGEVEWRFPLWWNFKGAAFGAAGNVGNKLNEILGGDFKTAWGGGIRFVVDPAERITIRVDYGKTPESEGLYVQLNEAF